MSLSVADAFTLEGERLTLATSAAAGALILAGPGAGKTHLLVAHACYLIDAEPGRVVLLTFSKAAAAEMRRRAERALPLGDRGRLLACTIHAYALDLLRAHGHRIGLPGPLEPLGTRDLQVLADDVARRERLDTLPDFATRLERYQRLAGDMNSPSLPLLVGLVDREMRARGRLTWDACIRLATELLMGEPEVLESVRHHDRHVLLDEAQDCDAAQLGLIEQVVGPPPGVGHLFVVMDPDQSLYSFRHANADVVRSWAGRYVDSEVELTENRRCANRLQALAKHVIGKPWSGSLEPGRARLHEAPDRDSEAAWLASRIRERLATGVSPDRIAVLGRRRTRIVEAERAIQAVVGVRSDPREQWSPPEGIVLTTIAFIRDWREVSNNVDVATSFLMDVVGLDAGAARVLLEEAIRRDQHPGDILAGEWWHSLRTWLEVRRTPIEVVDQVASSKSIAAADIQPLRALANNARNLGDLLKTSRAGPDPSHSHQSNAVLVTTFHGAKGLEFDTVFIVGCEDGTSPDYRAMTEKDLRDERRALYVAITRGGTEVLLTFVTRDRGVRKTARQVPAYSRACALVCRVAGVRGNQLTMTSTPTDTTDNLASRLGMWALRPACLVRRIHRRHQRLMAFPF